MKKLILILLAIALVSCNKMPQEKYDLAKHCLDSLRDMGAKQSIKYYELLEHMEYTDGQIANEQSKLFKKFDDVNKGLDQIIFDARNFIITYDKRDDTISASEPITNSNSSVVVVQIEMTFDTQQSPDDILRIASQVDENIRRNFITPKLISTKVIR